MPENKPLNWKPIRQSCTKAAKAMGHALGRFTARRSTPSVRTAMCKICYGCCWIAYSPTRGFLAGGRLIKYRCGTPEAASAKRITILRAGKPKRRLILPEPPYPEIGDTLTMPDGETWLVVGIEDTEILLRIPIASKDTV